MADRTYPNIAGAARVMLVLGAMKEEVRIAEARYLDLEEDDDKCNKQQTVAEFDC